MPKQTYYNLDSERRAEIDKACMKEFESKSLADISVGRICKSLDLSRAAFYKYFKSVEECYYYFLEGANFDSHKFIFQSLKEGENLLSALDKIPETVSKALFESNSIGILKSFFKHRNTVLEEGWEKYKMENSPQDCIKIIPKINLDGTSIEDKKTFKSLMKTISAVSHEIIKECLEDDWTREEFEREYSIRLKFIINGIKKI